jgi:uncharacterized protein (TIGR01777 family)
MKIAVTGASGLVGGQLCPALEAAGHEVVRLVRRSPAGAGEVSWDPSGGTVDAAGLEGVDAVVHLAGENVGGGRWNAARKKRIMESRDQGTRVLAEACAGLAAPPQVFVSASAVGIYGDRGDEVLTEGAAPGDGFLAEVCERWEGALAALEALPTRVVKMRTGIVLSRDGGALAKMYWPFFFCQGGVLGSGKQFMSWISLEDTVQGFVFALENDALEGPVNLVGPKAATNYEFTKALGRAMSRPTIIPLPAFVVRLVFGEMGEELLLAGQRVEPRALLDAGFEFRHPTLAEALESALQG